MYYLISNNIYKNIKFILQIKSGFCPIYIILPTAKNTNIPAIYTSSNFKYVLA